jgi:hypothetical protein
VGGVISLLGPFDDCCGLTITKSLTIRAEGVDGGATFSPQTTFPIVVNAGPTDVVTLEGLHFSGSSMVAFLSGGHLHVVGCVIVNGYTAGNDGIRFFPNTAAKLTVTDTVITNMGAGTGGGIVVNPASGGTAQVALERVTINGNAFGIAADGSNSTGGINMTIADSMIASNANDGIIATTSSGHAPIGVMVTNSKSVNNQFGIRALGPNVTVRAEGSKIIGNGTGLGFSGGGALLSAGNNVVEANGANGTFSAALALK